MTTQQEGERLVVHNFELAKKHESLFALSQLCLGLATSPIQERLTDDDRSRIASYVSDQIDDQRHGKAFNLQAAIQE